jgi:hypothetical protein
VVPDCHCSQHNCRDLLMLSQAPDLVPPLFLALWSLPLAVSLLSLHMPLLRVGRCFCKTTRVPD